MGERNTEAELIAEIQEIETRLEAFRALAEEIRNKQQQRQSTINNGLSSDDDDSMDDESDLPLSENSDESSEEDEPPSDIRTIINRRLANIKKERKMLMRIMNIIDGNDINTRNGLISTSSSVKRRRKRKPSSKWATQHLRHNRQKSLFKSKRIPSSVQNRRKSQPRNQEED